MTRELPYVIKHVPAEVLDRQRAILRRIPLNCSLQTKIVPTVSHGVWMRLGDDVP